MSSFLGHLVYRIFHGWNSLYPPLDVTAVNNGLVPDIYRQWLRELELDVGGKVKKPYTDSFEQLVQHVVIAETIPGNAAARGATQRRGELVTLTLTTRSMNDMIYVQHELLHCLQYRHPELFGPLGPGHVYPGTTGEDHWPYIFDRYGSH